MEKMYPIKRILVALDRSSQDEVLFNYVSGVATLNDLDIIYFLHVANDLDIPERIINNYPDLVAPIDESIRHDIEYDIKRSPLPEELDREIIIGEGNVAKEILKVIHRKSIDLLVLGRKSNEEANLSLVKKIVRSAPCSVSIIPNLLPRKLNRILVPIDYSENSLMALQQVELFTKKFPKLEVLTLNVFHVPAGYSRIGKSYEEFSEIMKQNANLDHTNFFKRHPIDIPSIESHFIRLDRNSLPYLINQFAVANNVDAIVLGSRGRDSFSSLIIGSVAEGLIESDQYWPLIIVKSKKDHFGLGKALMNV